MISIPRETVERILTNIQDAGQYLQGARRIGEFDHLDPCYLATVKLNRAALELFKYVYPERMKE